MSDKKNPINIISDISESVNNAIKNVSDKPTQNIGQTLADCWFLVFGGISQLAEKRKLKYAKELQEFKKSLEAKITSIPTENQTEPNMQLIMPALENVKYCLDKKQLQEMFANLISASLDNRRNSFVHPIFAEVLKTLTPLDAKNLILLQQHYHLPICDVLHLESENSNLKSVILQNLFLMNPECKNYEQQSLSINSLQKHGLIEIPFGQMISEPDAYKIYENCDELQQIMETFPRGLFALDKHIVRLTPLGHSFLEICCPN